MPGRDITVDNFAQLVNQYKLSITATGRAKSLIRILSLPPVGSLVTGPGAVLTPPRDFRIAQKMGVLRVTSAQSARLQRAGPRQMRKLR